MSINRFITKQSKRMQLAVLAFVLASTALTAGLQLVHAAGAATISFSPSNGNYEIGKSFSVNVNVNNGAVPTATAQVILNYDTSKLQLTNLASASEPFETQFGSATTGGTIDVTRASLNGDITGSNSFMRLTFKALAAGNGTVTVTSGSSILKADDSSQIWNESLTTATYSVVAPVIVAPTPTPNPTPAPTTPSPTPTNPSSPSPTPQNNTANPAQPEANETAVESNPPAAELVDEQPQVTERSLKRVSLSLKTKSPVRAKVLYGIDGQLSSATQETELSTNPTISLDPKLLVPGRTYSYKVVLTDEQGSVTETDIATFRAKGFNLRVLLRDKDNKPLAKVKVTLRSEPREGTTNDEGIVEFEDVELGDHTAYYKVDGQDQQQVLSVVDNATAEDGQELIPFQAIEIIATSDANLSALVVVLPVLVLASIGGLVVYLKMRSSKKVATNNYGYSPAQNNAEPQQDSHESEMKQSTRDYLNPTPPEVNEVIKPTNTLDK